MYHGGEIGNDIKKIRDFFFPRLAALDHAAKDIVLGEKENFLEEAKKQLSNIPEDTRPRLMPIMED